MRAWWNLIRNGRKTFIHTLSIITFSKFTFSAGKIQKYPSLCWRQNDYNFYWYVRNIMLFSSLCALYLDYLVCCLVLWQMQCWRCPDTRAISSQWWMGGTAVLTRRHPLLLSWRGHSSLLILVLSWGSLTKISCRYVGSPKYWFCALWWQIDTRFKSSNITHRGDGDLSWAAVQDVILASLKGFNLD